MQKEKFITERENTHVKKDRSGWSAETYVKVKGYCYIVTTVKRGNDIVSEAMEINDEGKSNGFISFSFNPFTAKRYPLGKEVAVATELKVRALHLEALAKFDSMNDELPSKAEAYKIVPGQVVFLNGYGQNETHHEREIIYQLTEDTYFSVNEKTLKLKEDKLSNLRDIAEKFGIGYYYKKGDIVQDMDFVNNLVIDAHEKKAKDEADRPAREAKEKADHEQAVAELISIYPHLQRDVPRGGKGVAINIRIELKLAFPETKFSVKSDYSSVEVNWVDGPSLASVNKIIGKYEDHCTDVTGDFRDYDPSLFNKVFCGCNFVSAYRSWSDKTEQIFTEWATEKRSVDAKRDARQLFYDCDLPADEFIITRQEGEHGWHVEPVTECADVQSAQTDSPKTANPGMTVTHNTEKNGIEISFEAKPDDAVLDALKKHGFRWSRFNRVWWAKYDAKLMEFALSL